MKLKLLPGTYEHGKTLKIVPEDRNDSTYVMVGGEHKDTLAAMLAAAPDMLEAARILCVQLSAKWPDAAADDRRTLERLIAKATGNRRD